MRLFRKVRFAAEDLWQTVCDHKWLSLVCTAVAVAGVVLGVILVNVFEYSWWYENRCNYAYRLFEGGLGLFFSFLLWTSVYYVCIAFCQTLPQIKYLSCLALFVACFYCGATAAAVIVCISVWGILFALLVSVAEVAGLLLACITACGTVCCRRTFREAICDTKLSFALLAVAFAVKIIAFFVILRLLTAVI